MKQVVFLPNYSKGNPYQNLLASALEQENWFVKIQDYPKSFFPLNSVANKNPKAAVLHLHWIHPLIANLMWARNAPIFYLKLLVLWVDFFIVKLRGKRIVWTVHNKYSHQKFPREREKKVRKCLYNWANKVITHGNNASETIFKEYAPKSREKIKSAFHGNYDGCYPSPNISTDEIKRSIGINPNSILILCFGLLQPYKGIEEVIKAVKKSKNTKIYLYIAGKIQNISYAEILTKLINNHSNIVYKFEFLNDQELINTINAAEAIACPFNSTLTSGSVILTMTQGKPLILPTSALSLDNLCDKGIFSYSTVNELSEVFDGLDKELLKEMGNYNKKKAKQLDWETAAKLTAEAYITK